MYEIIGNTNVQTKTAVRKAFDFGIFGEENKEGDDPVGGIKESIKLQIESDGVSIPVFKNMFQNIGSIAGFKFNITSIQRKGVK